MKYLKLTDNEYEEAFEAVDKLVNQGIGELIEENPTSLKKITSWIQ